MNRAERRYWDACCFIAFITKEQNRHNDCRMLLEEARQGGHIVVTAAHTIVEITRKSDVGTLYDYRPSIDRFFDNSYFLIVDIDRAVTERARDLIWKHAKQGLRWSDAIHLAAALRSGSRTLYTYDGKLLNLDSEFQHMSIEEPQWVGQAPLPFPSSSRQGA